MNIIILNTSYPINSLLKKCNFNASKLRYSMLHLPTKSLRIILKVITGHNNLNNHLFRMNMETNPLCEYCDLENSGIDPVFCPDETAMHILEDCSAFSILRINHFQEFKLNFEELVNSKTPLITTLHEIVKFFKRTGCFEKIPRFTEPISPRR